MSTSNCFCFIPAKSASTRLPKKNILKLGGKEMIGHSIDAAKDTGLFGDQIIVSTESHEVKAIAEKFGAQVPYIREDKLAKDPYGIVDVVLDFFDRFPEYTKYEYLALVLPTCPLITAEDITNTLNITVENDFDGVMSVSENEKNSFRSIRIEDHQLTPLFPEHIKKKYQELSSTYYINGGCIVVAVSAFLEHRTYFLPNLGASVIPKSRSVDIDTMDDYLYAQFLYDLEHSK